MRRAARFNWLILLENLELTRDRVNEMKIRNSLECNGLSGGARIMQFKNYLGRISIL
jgi:hypothetical protein